MECVKIREYWKQVVTEEYRERECEIKTNIQVNGR